MTTLQIRVLIVDKAQSCCIAILRKRWIAFSRLGGTLVFATVTPADKNGKTIPMNPKRAVRGLSARKLASLAKSGPGSYASANTRQSWPVYL